MAGPDDRDLPLGPLEDLDASSTRIIHQSACVFFERRGATRRWNLTLLEYAVGIVSVWGMFVCSTVGHFSLCDEFVHYPVFFVIPNRDGIVRGRRVLGAFLRSNHLDFDEDDSFGVDIEMQLGTKDSVDAAIALNGPVIEALRLGGFAVTIPSWVLVYLIRVYSQKLEHLIHDRVSPAQLASGNAGRPFTFPLGLWETLPERFFRILDKNDCLFCERERADAQEWTLRTLQHAVGVGSVLGYFACVQEGYSFLQDDFIRFPVYFVIPTSNGTLRGRRVAWVHMRTSKLFWNSSKPKDLVFANTDPVGQLIQQNAAFVDAIYRSDETTLPISSEELVILVRHFVETPQGELP